MNKCKLCQIESIKLVDEIEGYQKNKFFKIYSCKKCNVSWSEPGSSDDFLYEKIYQYSQFVPGYSRYAHLANALLTHERPYEYLKYFESNYFSVLNAVEKFTISHPNPKIAEIGCGKGYLTHALNVKGLDCTGFDLSAHAISFAKMNFGDYYECRDITDTEGDDRFFDVIIGMEIIEHLSDPVAVIRSLLKRLTPNGILILSTPLRHATNKSIWDTDLPPVHLWWFSKESIIFIAESLDLNLNFVDVYPFYRSTGIKYPRQRINEKLRTSFFDQNFDLIVKESTSKPSITKLLKNKIRKFFRNIIGETDRKITQINDNADSIVFTLSKRKA